MTYKPSETMSETIIRPIKSDGQYKQVMAQIDQLLDCPPNSPEADLLEVLSILADDHENKTTPILPPDPIDAIRYQADELGLSSKELAALLGGKNRLSEVLNRKRPLTLKMIKTLFQQLHIPAESLLAA